MKIRNSNIETPAFARWLRTGRRNKFSARGGSPPEADAPLEHAFGGETRNSKRVSGFDHSDFRFVSTFGFRASDFPRRGQAMLLTVLVLSAVLLSVSTIAGLLTVYQLRQATAVANSVRAIYAAEAGLELELYRWEKDRDDCHGLPLPPPPTAGATSWEPPAVYPVSQNCYPAPTLQNGASFAIRITYRPGPGGAGAELESVKSTGQSGTVARAFQVGL